MAKGRAVIVGLVAVVFGCKGSSEPSAAPPPPPSLAAEPASPPPSLTRAKATEPPKASPPTPAVRWAGGFATPESVLCDEARDRYLVSNINGKPVDADGNGFISVLSPEGSIASLTWIEGGKDKVALDAPKGMAIAGDVLYVADLTAVRMFDAATGKPKGSIALEGASFVNDVAAGPDGRIWVSDSGIAGADMKPSGTDAVWVIERGKARLLARSTELAQPNGVWHDGRSIVVTTFGSDEIYRLDETGKKSDATKLPNGRLDGIVGVGDSLLVSSWQASTVFRGKLGGPFEPLVAGIESPADIGFDKKRSRLLVPRFLGDAVEAYEVR